MTLNQDADNLLDPLLRTFSADLEATVADQLAQIYISGTAEMVSWAGLPFEGPPMGEAIRYAREEAARLVTQMNEETKRRLAEMIGDAIENKRGVPGLARDIHNEIGDMSRYRSRVIARTETADALTHASLDKMGEMGVTGKEWVTVGDDRVSTECRGNEGEGPIPVKQMFSGGVMGPPQHPQCRCAVAPVMLPDVKPPKPSTKPTPKVEPPTKGVPKGTQDFIDNKVKVTGKTPGDIGGLDSTVKAIKDANLPSSHLETVQSIQLNVKKLQARTHGSMAYCDNANNIVLAGKVGHENVIHEIGHAFWNTRVYVPDKISKIKYDIMDVFTASTKTGKGFVSQYAKSNVDEFFAESYAAFAKDPVAFTKLNPSMGKILKILWKW